MHAYGFDAKSLKFIDSYLAGRKERVKINSSFSEWSEVQYGVPKGSIMCPLLFNIYLCDMFFSEISIDFANYADDTTTYTCDLQMEKVIEIQIMLKS